MPTSMMRTASLLGTSMSAGSMPATSMPAMPATGSVMHRDPTMDEAPTVPAAAYSGEALAEEADVVGLAE